MILKIFFVAAICLLSVFSSIASAEDQLDVKSVYLSSNDMGHFYSSEIHCSMADGCPQMKIKRSVAILFSNFKQDVSKLTIKVAPYIRARGFIDLNQDVDFAKTGGCGAIFDAYSRCDHKLPAETRYSAETLQISSQEVAQRMIMMTVEVDAPVNVRGNLFLDLEITRPDGSREMLNIPVLWPSGGMPRIQ